LVYKGYGRELLHKSLKKVRLYKNMEKGRELLIDAVSPTGNMTLLEEHFYGVLENHLKNPRKKCQAENYKESPMKMKMLKNMNSDSEGCKYRLKISLEEI